MKFVKCNFPLLLCRRSTSSPRAPSSCQPEIRKTLYIRANCTLTWWREGRGEIIVKIAPLVRVCTFLAHIMRVYNRRDCVTRENIARMRVLRACLRAIAFARSTYSPPPPPSYIHTFTRDISARREVLLDFSHRSHRVLLDTCGRSRNRDA